MCLENWSEALNKCVIAMSYLYVTATCLTLVYVPRYALSYQGYMQHALLFVCPGTRVLALNNAFKDDGTC